MKEKIYNFRITLALFFFPADLRALIGQVLQVIAEQTARLVNEGDEPVSMEIKLHGRKK